ncbi:MAG TPA: RagB/SusD family nutrient uptake outer membrane protein [Puia sp.]|nr:RagB/SusD family nutrient uptake outer membrane protein [Puia sp.]
MNKRLFICGTIIAIVLAAGFGSGCKKFLDKKPLSTVSPVNYYKNDSEVESALSGVYNILGLEFMWGGRIPVRHNASTDESFFSYTKFPTGPFWYNYDASDPTVTEMWTYLYQGIERANTLLANLDGAVMDSVRKSQVRGEALFLRAFYYFTLVQYWGDVPLKLAPSSSVNKVDIARTPAKTVYAQILKDMEEAEGLVNTSPGNGNTERISQSTVRGILARVCLTMAGAPLNDVSKFQDARDWAMKVVQSGIHELDTSYKQIYINECQDIDDYKECIWETGNWGNNNDANRLGGRIGNENGVACSSSAPATVGYAYGFISTTMKLYKLYGAGDLRRDWAISTYTLNAAGTKTTLASTKIYQRNCAKWRREYELDRPMNKNYTPINFPILRYADVLLMLAEAENEVNGPTATAYESLNEVRRRGYGLPVHTPSAVADVSGLTQDGLRQVIRDERARELCFEGLRKPDLIRWGIFLNAMQESADEIMANGGTTYAYAAAAAGRVSERHLLYPIPSTEMSLNKAMVQNPGW